jgi:hypothetical protein
MKNAGRASPAWQHSLISTGVMKKWQKRIKDDHHRQDSNLFSKSKLTIG